MYLKCIGILRQCLVYSWDPQFKQKFDVSKFNFFDFFFLPNNRFSFFSIISSSVKSDFSILSYFVFREEIYIINKKTSKEVLKSGGANHMITYTAYLY